MRSLRSTLVAAAMLALGAMATAPPVEASPRHAVRQVDSAAVPVQLTLEVSAPAIRVSIDTAAPAALAASIEILSGHAADRVPIGAFDVTAQVRMKVSSAASSHARAPADRHSRSTSTGDVSALRLGRTSPLRV